MQEISTLEFRRVVRLLRKRKRRMELLRKVGYRLLCAGSMILTGFVASVCSIAILENTRGRVIVEMAAVFFAVFVVGHWFFDRRKGG